MKGKVTKKKGVKNPAKYYSVWFSDQDVNNLSDIEINEHENGIDLTVKQIQSLPNHFLKKSEATKAKRVIWNALKSPKL